MTIQHWLRKSYYWLFPTHCLLCHQLTADTDLCAACTAELPWLTGACPRCGAQQHNRLLPELPCGACLTNPPPYDNTVALFQYAAPISHWVLALKFRDKLLYARVLGKLLAQRITQHYPTNKPEWIIPVPLHPLRLRQRGYNQALEIARPLAKHLTIPLLHRDCQRTKATEPQASSTAQQRRRNLNGAFWLHPNFRAQHVALVDDVVTTGSTAAELAHTLKRAGVTTVDVWCCAKTNHARAL